MVTITKGILNKVGFSVRELSICDEPFEYRIIMASENSDDINYELIKTPVNLGSRLQVFEIEEGTEIDFALEGYYSYEIYQTTSNNLVEVGLLRVQKESPAEQILTNHTNIQVYGRN